MTTLEDLYIYYCRRCDCKPNSRFCKEMRDAFDAASGAREIETIDLSSNYLGPRGVEPVLEMVRNVYSVRKLDLRNNMLTHDDVEKVMKATCRHPNVQEINLSFNNIHDSSTANLLHLLRTNNNILCMMLDGCNFTPQSLASIEEQLNTNRVLWKEKCDAANTDVTEGPSAVEKKGPRYAPYRSETAGILTPETSGGHFHYASWRKNPQYTVSLTKAALTTITLKVADPQPTRPLGFAVVRGNALLKVIDVTADDILGESSFDDTCCKLQLRLDAAEKVKNSAPYVIIPFTFQPGRSAEFVLSAEIPPEVDGIVSIQALESRFDWIVNEVEGNWSIDNSGGSMAFPTWRENDAVRVTYEGSISRGIANVFVVLSKANDCDDNDEKEIGLYVLRPDFRNRFPCRLSPDSIVYTADHRHETTVSLKFEVPCGSLDFFLLPTTTSPGELGPYTVSIFSTCPVAVNKQHFPHEWAVQEVEGVWDSHRNGGSRSENPRTWIHNPCYELTNNTNEEIDLFLSLERSPLPPKVTTVEEGQLVEEVPQQELKPKPPIEVGVMLTKLDSELQIVGSSAWNQRREASLALNSLPPGTYYLIPLTRRAGMNDDYKLRVFSSKSVHMSLEIPLSKRLREKQLQKYNEENETRRKKATEGGSASNLNSLVAEARALQKFDNGFEHAQQQKDTAIQQYLSQGTLFTDRDFPRGGSSLWKDPECIPSDAPAVFCWKRPSEIFPGRNLTFLPSSSVLGANLSGEFGNDWFHSALSLVSTRPDLLAKIVGSYQAEYGIAQFFFFKNGIWRTVTIDDYLPVDALGDLCFAESVDPDDVFVPLVEKAFAKLHRCYEATRGPAEATREALVDLTGGLCHVNRLFGPAGKQWAMKELWKTLCQCRESNKLMALSLSKDTPAAEEKKHCGLHLGRLYPVLDARDVEGKKLIKLGNFWGNDLQWKGKWCTGSTNWTPTLRKAVDYNEQSDVIWVSFEEAMYYFGLLYVVSLHENTAWIEGGFSATHTGGSLLDDTWVNNPQYSIAVHTTEPTTVHLGIHQPDSRMSILRSVGAEASYNVELGLTLIRCDSDSRRLMTITDTEMPSTIKAVACRDSVASFIFEPNYKYILMPFSMTAKHACQYHLSAHGNVPISITPIASDTKTSVEGEWKEASAGGPRRSGSWRNNPQFLLYPSEDSQITIVLRQRNDLASTTAHIGFTVMKARGIRRTLHCDDEDVVLEVPYKNDHAVVGTVKLEGMAARKGMPYLIVPSTSVFGTETGFSLEVISNKKVQLKPIDPATDWCCKVIQHSFSYKEGTAGGSKAYSSWRNNPQLLLKFPMERSGNLLVVASNNNANDQNPIGLTIMKSDPWDQGKRRKLLCKDEEVLGTAEPSVGYAELPLNYQVKREPLVLMPFTSLPTTEMEFTLSFYCSSEIEVEPVLEWKQEAVEGNWELGLSAGGNREKNRSWINNPFYTLNVTRPTRLVVIALQYPTGPQKPVVRRVGKERVFLPPPIVNAASKVCFGFDVTHSDKQNTPIHSSKHTYDSEITMLLELPPCEKTPYFIVPHTFEPEQEADFKIVVFADEPIQVAYHPKARRFY